MRILLIASMIVFAGCSTITGNKTFLNNYDQIQKGVTTRQQVIDMLGDPTQVDHPDAKSTVLIYEQRKESVENYFVGTRKVATQRLSVFINENDIVTDYKLDSLSDDYLVSGGSSPIYQPNAAVNQTSISPGVNHY